MLGWETIKHCESIWGKWVSWNTSQLNLKSTAAVVLMNSIYLLNYVEVNVVGFSTIMHYIGYEYTS
jgi:hypothetical protein